MTSAIVGSALFGMAGYFGGSFAIDRQNRAQLNELTELELRRAELQAGFAFIALGDLVLASAAGCDDASLGQMRRQVYSARQPGEVCADPENSGRGVP